MGPLARVRSGLVQAFQTTMVDILIVLACGRTRGSIGSPLFSGALPAYARTERTALERRGI